MPSFDSMKNLHSSTVLGDNLKEMSNYIIDETFSNGTSYRVGKIYDCNMEELNNGKPLEFKFLKTQTYTVNKDQVEYMIQFRPGVNPEIDFDFSDDKKHRLSFYIDIKDENSKEINKWLIVGKDDAEFDKYNVLKCNWLFEWLDDNRMYRSCLGVMRDRNNYNSGVWSDGFSTSVENQTSFIIPNNEITKYIDYDKRFMITDNEIHPKTYRVTKLMDIFPLGNIKIVLSQSHYNEHTDLCGKDEFFEDDKIHMICDYFKSALPPLKGDTNNPSWKIKGGSDKLYIHGQPIYLQAIPEDSKNTNASKWDIFVDGTLYSIEDLEGYFEIDDTQTNMFAIKAINKVMAKYIVTIKLYDDDCIVVDPVSGDSRIKYCDSIEMEVTV